MSKEKRRVPKLRFPGFTEDWEQRKLGECVDISTGYPFDSQDFNENGEYLVITNGNIQENTPFVLNNVGNRIDLDDSLKKYILDIDDLLITMDGTVGRVAIVVDNKLVLAQRVCRIKSNEPYYIYQLLSKNDFIQSMNKIGHGGTIKHISLSEISEYQAFYPKSQKERIKISSVLTNYDKLITLHQRKLDNLKLKKKALLQKLFPKNGERYPELRFPGFTDAWEQRKADYIFKSVTDKGYPELPVLSASQELGMVYRDQNGIDIQHDKKNETSYKRVLPGQFVIHLRSFQGGFAYSEIEGITSPAYTVMSFKNSSEQYGLFWKHVFKSETFIKRLETITYGIRDGRSISFSDFKSLLLQYPSFSEQKLIGDSIAVIERGITLHQRKLDHLQLQKKALLQQMFV